MQFSKEDTDFS